MKAILFFLIFNYFIPLSVSPAQLAQNYQFKFPEWKTEIVPAQREMVVEATAYSADESSNTTSLGEQLIPYRTLAVDPSVIPYGSMVYFHSTGETYVAGDCGGAIVGNRVDKALGNMQECMRYGRRNERVTVTYPFTTLKITERK